MALVHDFVLIPDGEFASMESFEIYGYKEEHPENVIELSDDLFTYMSDSLKWIETTNPGSSRSQLGFNYHGHSIIKRNGASKLSKVLEAWHLLFSQAPDVISLRGLYTSIEGESLEKSGRYEKLIFNKHRTLSTLEKLIALANKVEPGKYNIFYMGI